MRGPLIKRVDRLVGLSVLGAIGLTWLVLVSLDALRIFVGELNAVGAGHYSLTSAVIYVLLTVPRRLYDMFIYAALIGSLLGLGALANSAELTALRAAGMSKLRICASVGLCLAALTLLVVLLGESLAPWGERRAQALMLAAKSSEVALARGGTLWARDGDSVIGARRARASAGGEVELADVRVFRFDADGRLAALLLAREAQQQQGEWLLRDVRSTEFGAHDAVSTEQPSMRWKSSLDPQLLASGIVQPRYMSVRDLRRNIGWLERNQQDAEVYRRAVWARLLQPVNIIVLTLCVLPFAFGALRSGGLSKRLFIGILVALGFHFLQRATVSFGSVYDLPPALANLLPPLLFAVAAVVYFRRHA